MVSIIILVQDRFDFFKRCVDSIVEHTKSDFELVLILQDVKDDRIIRLIDNLTCRKVVAVNDSNTGVTPGRNQGIDLSIGDYLLFFDDDAYVDNNLDYIPDSERELDWLERMTRYFVGNVGVVAQSGYYINPKKKGIFFEVKSRGSRCDVGQGYCFMFSRSVVDTIGKLDPFFGKFWHEESEYALRAKNSGFDVIGTMYIGVHHMGSGSGDDGSYGKKFDYMYNKWKNSFDRILVGEDNWT